MYCCLVFFFFFKVMSNVAGHCTHSDFDFRILQHNVSHCQYRLFGAVVQQQHCQTDQVVLSNKATIL